MAGNFGAGLGSFMTGMMQGANFRQQLDERKENQRIRGLQTKQLEQQIGDGEELRAISKQGAADAGAARDADIAKNGGSDKNVDSLMDYYAKTTGPKMIQHWMSTGQQDKAQAFDSFMQQKEVQKGVKAWAGAVSAFHSGDSEGFKTNLMKAYNQKGYFDDGYTASDIKDLKNDKGQLLGYEITFKDKDGKETKQQYDGDDVSRLALQALSPDQVLSYGMDQLKQAATAKAALAKEDRSFNRDLTKLGIQQQGTIAAQNNQSQLIEQREANKLKNGTASKKVLEAEGIANALRAQGKSDQYIQAVYPKLLGIDRAARSQNDRLDGYIANMAKSDLDFASLTPKQQADKALELMRAVDEAGAMVTSEQQVQQADGNAAGAAKAAGAAVQSGGKGVPMLDTKTGKIIYR